MRPIVPNLWFDTEAEQAAEFYVSVFPDSRIVSRALYPEGAPGPAGTVMTVEFELDGQRFVGINGGPQFPFTEAVSFQITCETQEEVDRFWDALTEGGEESMCGWLKDRYGLSWQVVPVGMEEVFADPDPSRAQRAMQAMMGMRKLDLAALQDAQRRVDGRVARRLRGDHDRRRPVLASGRAVAEHRVALHAGVAREPLRAVVGRLRQQRPAGAGLVAHDVADAPLPAAPHAQEVDARRLGIDVVARAQRVERDRDRRGERRAGRLGEDADRAVPDVRIADQELGRRHDLGDSSFVVCTQQCCAVGCNDVVANLVLQHGIVGDANHPVGIPGQRDISALVVPDDLMSDIGASEVRCRVHVGAEAKDGDAVLGAGWRDGGIDIAVLVEMSVGHPDLDQFLDEQTAEVLLLLRRRLGLGGAIGLGVDDNVAKKAVGNA